MRTRSPSARAEFGEAGLVTYLTNDGTSRIIILDITWVGYQLPHRQPASQYGRRQSLSFVNVQLPADFLFSDRGIRILAGASRRRGAPWWPEGAPWLVPQRKSSESGDNRSP